MISFWDAQVYSQTLGCGFRRREQELPSLSPGAQMALGLSGRIPAGDNLPTAFVPSKSGKLT